MTILVYVTVFMGVMLLFLCRRDGDIGRMELLVGLLIMLLCLHPHAQRML